MFIDSNDVSVIPTSWKINNGTCFWPTGTSQMKLTNLIKNKEAPNPSSNMWHQYKIRVLGQSGGYLAYI